MLHRVGVQSRAQNMVLGWSGLVSLQAKPLYVESQRQQVFANIDRVNVNRFELYFSSCRELEPSCLVWILIRYRQMQDTRRRAKSKEQMQAKSIRTPARLKLLASDIYLLQSLSRSIPIPSSIATPHSPTPYKATRIPVFLLHFNSQLRINHFTANTLHQQSPNQQNTHQLRLQLVPAMLGGGSRLINRQFASRFKCMNDLMGTYLVPGSWVGFGEWSFNELVGDHRLRDVVW